MENDGARVRPRRSERASAADREVDRRGESRRCPQRTAAGARFLRLQGEWLEERVEQADEVDAVENRFGGAPDAEGGEGEEESAADEQAA